RGNCKIRVLWDGGQDEAAICAEELRFGHCKPGRTECDRKRRPSAGLAGRELQLSPNLPHKGPYDFHSKASARSWIEPCRQSWPVIRHRKRVTGGRRCSHLDADVALGVFRRIGD